MKKSYVVIVVILVAGVITYLAEVIQWHIDTAMPTRVALVVSPGIVAAACFLTSKRYNHSKIFGKSYMLLGAGQTAVLVGELIFFYHVDHMDFSQYAILGDVLILLSYPLMMAHIVINVRYFAARLEVMHVLPTAGIPAGIVPAYMLAMSATTADAAEIYYYLPFVIASSMLLGLAAAAFATFRQTVLGSAWFMLLAGIMIGTTGDILYNYSATLDAYSFGDFSNTLWIISSLVMIYALYRHKKSI